MDSQDTQKLFSNGQEAPREATAIYAPFIGGHVEDFLLDQSYSDMRDYLSYTPEGIFPYPWNAQTPFADSALVTNRLTVFTGDLSLGEESAQLSPNYTFNGTTTSNPQTADFSVVYRPERSFNVPYLAPPPYDPVSSSYVSRYLDMSEAVQQAIQPYTQPHYVSNLSYSSSSSCLAVAGSNSQIPTTYAADGPDHYSWYQSIRDLGNENTRVVVQEDPVLPSQFTNEEQITQHHQSYEASGARKRKKDEMTEYGESKSLGLPGSKRKSSPKQSVQVRAIGSCIRCALQHKACILNNKDPTGECESYATLFRRFADPISGRLFTTNSDTDILKPIKVWNIDEIRAIELTQDFKSPLKLYVRKVQRFDLSGLDEAKHFVYGCPWALLDMSIATREVEMFLDRSTSKAVSVKVGQKDRLARLMFEMAQRMAHGREGHQHSTLIHNCLKLWMASRCIEGGWHLDGPETLGLPTNNENKIPLPSVGIVDAQIFSILVQYLETLRSSVLGKIHEFYYCTSKNRKARWFELLTATFILLHNCECVMKHQRKWALENNSPYKYTPATMELVKGILAASKVFLAHFHYALRGQTPFTKGWDLKESRKVAELSKKQLDFVGEVQMVVCDRLTEFEKLQKTTEYEEDNWFTGQLFLPEWKPPHTIEEAPLAV